VHASREAHETPFKSAPAGGLGTRWIDQLVPFQRSANDRLPWEFGPPPLDPTTVHAIRDAHDSPLIKTSAPGLGNRKQLEPPPSAIAQFRKREHLIRLGVVGAGRHAGRARGAG
jgi:hypothetical protein